METKDKNLTPEQIQNAEEALNVALPLNTYDSIPQPNTSAKTIVGLVKDSGRVSGYQLSDGSVVTREQGVSMARNGEIKDVGIAHKNETEYLKTLPDAKESNNLTSLPSISSAEADEINGHTTTN